VLIFPEAVVPRWSEATEAFWRDSLDSWRTRDQILALGAGLLMRATQHVKHHIKRFWRGLGASRKEHLDTIASVESWKVH
jgi:hypothetical protein